MKKYPAYKPSGVDWIGDVPEHWKRKRLKNLTPSTVGGIWGNERLGDENDRICLRVADFDYDRLTISNEDFTIRNIQLGEEDPKLLNKGDLLLEKSGGGEKTPVGRCVFYDGRFEGAICSNFINVLHPDLSIVNPRFLTFLHSYLYRVGVNSQYIKQTTGIQNLDINSYLSEVSFLPPLPEQQTITSYLDRKTALIDTLIEKTTQKIALLQEQRTALINQAVTKGLDPDVPMKDSGVEWIGEVPREWEVKKVKQQFQILGGGTPSKSDESYWNGAIPWVSPKDMKSNSISDSEERISELGLQNSTSTLVPKNSLLIVVRSGILKHSIPIAINIAPVSINQDLKALLSDSFEFSKFFYYFIKGNEANLLLEWTKQGATVESVEMDFFENFKLPVPPTVQCEKINQFLDKKTSRIDTLILHEQQKITLLKEYRQVLISEVVTGKIDVRDA